MNYTESPSRAFSFRSAFSYNSPLPDRMVDDLYRQQLNTFDFKYHQIPIDDLQSLESATEENFASKIARKVIVFICYLTVIVLMPISLWFCIKRVHALERLVIFRLGKLQPVNGPGFCFILPFVDMPIKVDLNPKVYSLPKQQVITVDRAIIEVLAEIKYCVCHVTCFVTRLYKQEDTIKELVLCCFSNVICGKEQSDIENDISTITSYVKTELNKTVINWGIEILEVNITTVKILKEAETINPLNSILNTLKNVTCESSKQIPSNLIPPIHFNSPITQTCDVNDTQVPLIKFDGDDNNDVLISKLRIIANEAAKRIPPSKISSVLLFKIMEINYDRHIYMTFHEGTGTVFEDENRACEPNLTIRLSMNVMDDLLSLKISPIKAYSNGEIQINGDFSLLQVFENL